MDFPVPLLWTELDCDALSLAEILDSAEVTFEIWHETPSAKYGKFIEHLLCLMFIYLEAKYRLFPPVTIFLDLFLRACYFFNAFD